MTNPKSNSETSNQHLDEADIKATETIRPTPSPFDNESVQIHAEATDDHAHVSRTPSSLQSSTPSTSQKHSIYQPDIEAKAAARHQTLADLQPDLSTAQPVATTPQDYPLHQHTSLVTNQSDHASLTHNTRTESLASTSVYRDDLLAQRHPERLVHPNNYQLKQNTLVKNYQTDHPINLAKLTKTEFLRFGLSWFSQATDKEGGFFSKLFNKKQVVDLDISCLLYHKSGRLLDRVWFKQVRSRDHSVRLHGDSLNGTDRGDSAELDYRMDQEKIDLLLDKLGDNVYEIAFVVNSFHQQDFNVLRFAQCHLRTMAGDLIIAEDLTELPNKCAAYWFASLQIERNNDTPSYNLLYRHQVLNCSTLEEIEAHISELLMLQNIPDIKLK